MRGMDACRVEECDERRVEGGRRVMFYLSSRDGKVWGVGRESAVAQSFLLPARLGLLWDRLTLLGRCFRAFSSNRI